MAGHVVLCVCANTFSTAELEPQIVSRSSPSEHEDLDPFLFRSGPRHLAGTHGSEPQTVSRHGEDDCFESALKLEWSVPDDA